MKDHIIPLEKYHLETFSEVAEAVENGKLVKCCIYDNDLGKTTIPDEIKDITSINELVMNHKASNDYYILQEALTLTLNSILYALESNLDSETGELDTERFAKKLGFEWNV